MPRRAFLCLSFILLLSYQVVLAQSRNNVLHGSVRDAHGRPLAGVSVVVKETNSSTATNNGGEFTIVVPSNGQFAVQFSARGYFAFTQIVDAAHSDPVEVNLTATPVIQQEVHVTASRLDIPLAQNPAATSVVGADTLITMPRTVGAEEALISVAGVKVDNQANQERVHISIRGQGILTERGVRGIGVLLDGLPLNDPSGFAPDLFDVDWAAVQEVHVVRGPVAFLYGGGSSGGVIDIATTTPEGNGHSTLQLTGGSNTFYKGHFDYAGKLGSAPAFISLARAEGDGYRVHTRFYGDNVYGKVNFHPTSRFRINVIGSGTGYFNQNPEGLNLQQVLQDPRQPNPDSLTFNEYQKTKRAGGGLTGQFAINDSQNLSFTFYARRARFDESVPSSVKHLDFTTPGGSAQYSLEAKSGAMQHHLSAGLDLDGQWIDNFAHPNLGNAEEGAALLADQSITQKRVGGFLTDRLSLGAKWSVLGSVRWDQIGNHLNDQLRLNGLDLSGDRTFHQITGRAGLSFNPTEALGFYTSWGQGFLPPATEELYANPDAIGGFNRRLVPATSWGYEGGARGNVTNRLWYDVSVFHLETSNDFERYRRVDRPLETFYGNAGKSSRNGLETEFRWMPVPRLRLTGTYTYSHFQYTSYSSEVYPGDLAGNWLPNSPNHQLYFDTSLQLPRSLYLSVGTQALSRAFIDPTNAAYIEGYGLLNARMSKQWQHEGATWRIFVSARNLTSTRYIAFTEPDPDGNSYQPGPEREVFGGLELRF